MLARFCEQKLIPKTIKRKKKIGDWIALHFGRGEGAEGKESMNEFRLEERAIVIFFQVVLDGVEGSFFLRGFCTPPESSEIGFGFLKCYVHWDQALAHAGEKWEPFQVE